MAEGQEAAYATSSVCFCCVGVDTTHSTLRLMRTPPPPPPPPPHFLSLATLESCLSTCFSGYRLLLPSMLSIYPSVVTWYTASTHVLPGNWFPQNAPDHYSPLVGAVMIRLWIICLDHCFPLLCWLGAIHLPPSSGGTDAVKLPLQFTSLLPFLPPPTFPDPITRHDLHLSSSIQIQSSINWRASASPVHL